MAQSQVAKGFTYRHEFVAGWTGPAQVQKEATESAGYAKLEVEYLRLYGRSGPRLGEGRGLAALALSSPQLALCAIQISSLGHSRAHSGDTKSKRGFACE
jgi:hypothetical protein